MLPARDNPFRMQRIEALRYRLDENSWQRLLARFAAQHWRGVLVGPHGSGKTTLREEIETRLRADGWKVRTVILGDDRMISWPDLRALCDGADGRTLLCLDGLDRLSTLHWWRLRRATRTVGGILATSHVAGRLPTLHQHHTSPALLRELVRELLGDDGDSLTWTERCDTVFIRHCGDLRACLRTFYDDVIEKPSRHVTP